MKRYFFVLLVFCGLLLTGSAWAEEPGKVIVETIDKGLTVLTDSELSKTENLILRREKLWEIIEPVFNFEEISQRALGQYWQDRTPAERKEFVQLFTDILKGSYLGKSDAYSGQKIVYHREKVIGDRGKVHTTFLTSEGKEIILDFNMINLNGHWKIYDIIIEGVSLIGNYRSQFSSVLKNSSYAELVQKMREKRNELAAEDSNQPVLEEK